MTTVTVLHVYPADGQTIWTGTGVEEKTGDHIGFAGDWRPMRDLARAVADGIEPIVELERWQILRRHHPKT